MALIDTRLGPLEESDLAKTVTPIDEPTRFYFRIEYRFKDSPEVALLRRIEFSRPYVTPEGRWDTCPFCTAAKGGEHVAGCELRDLLARADERSAEPVAVYRGWGFEKVNQNRDNFHGQVAIDEGNGIQFAEAKDLVRSEGVVRDDANEFSTFVEFRRPGSDRVIHRSVGVTLKRFMAPKATAGDLVSVALNA